MFLNNCLKNFLKNFSLLLNTKDYVVFAPKSENPNGGRPTVDAMLSSTLAKKLSMKAGGERGEEARKYFIHIEEKVKQKTIDRSMLSPQMQMLFTMVENQATLELTQKPM